MRSLVTAAILVVLYAVYAVCVTPLIQSKSGIGPMLSLPLPLPGGIGSRLNVEMAERHLARAPWATTASFQLHSGNAFIYAGDLSQVDDNEAVELKPFALIWVPDGASAGDAPYTLTADSARIEFDGPVQTSGFESREIIQGRIDGEVFVSGPKNLWIEGRNFYFKKDIMRLYSDVRANFRYDGHEGVATGVEIDLLEDEKHKGSKDLHVAGVDRFRLRKNVQLNLHVPAEKSGEPPVKVVVKSQGPFDYSVAEKQAVLNDTVQVLRQTAPNEHDYLKCNRLLLTFEPKPKEPNAPGAEAKAKSKSGPGDNLAGGMALKELRADGGTVRLISQENDLNVWLSELVYHAETRTAVLTHHEVVKVRTGNSELLSPEIRVTHSEGSRIVEAVCGGPGSLTHRDPETSELLFTAEWVKRLSYAPDPRTKLDLITIEDQAIVTQGEHDAGLAADLIKLWIQQPPKSADEPSAPTVAEAAAPQEPRARPKPQHMLATRNVVMIASGMEAKTKELEVWFENATTSTAAPASENPPGGTTGDAPGSPGRESRDVQPDEPPVTFVADRVNVRAVNHIGDESPQVVEVWTLGSVRATQPATDKQAASNMAGDRLRFLNQGPNQQEVTLYGEPAAIDNGDMHIEGRELHVDSAANRAWVAGAGQMQVPVTQDLEGNKLPAPEQIQIVWSEQMDFDGLTADFFGDVSTVLDQHRMNTQEMHISLSERVSFSDPPKNSEVEIRSVRCKDGVTVDSHQYLEGEIVGLRRSAFWDFSLDRATGEMSATGPGWVTQWRPSATEKSAVVPVVSVQANKPVSSDAPEWSYTRIDFSGRMTGNLDQRSSTFHDGVQIVYGPVSRHLATVDAVHPPLNGGWMRSRELTITQNSPPESKEQLIEAVARGDAMMSGRNKQGTFNARADVISFDESKDLYVLSGQGRHDATITRQVKNGVEGEPVSAKKMFFWAESNHVKMERVSQGSGAP